MYDVAAAAAPPLCHTTQGNYSYNDQCYYHLRNVPGGSPKSGTEGSIIEQRVERAAPPLCPTTCSSSSGGGGSGGGGSGRSSGTAPAAATVSAAAAAATAAGALGEGVQEEEEEGGLRYRRFKH